jgi:hypothetical protein
VFAGIYMPLPASESDILAGFSPPFKLMQPCTVISVRCFGYWISIAPASLAIACLRPAIPMDCPRLRKLSIGHVCNLKTEERSSLNGAA